MSHEHGTNVQLASFSVTIEGEEIQLQPISLPLDQVRLDPDNPRIKRLLKPPISPESIRRALLEQDGVEELRKQIRDNKGLVERILVDQSNAVVEGNCRTAIYLWLREARPTEPQWQTIPALLLPPGVTARQIAILRAVFHVQPNKIRWGTYEQQRHLHEMHTKLNMDVPSIARVLGLQERIVRRLLDAYEAMTTYYLSQTNPTEERRVWSHFNELYKNKSLEGYRASAKNVQEFAKLVVEKKIPHGADVRKLPSIVNNPKAYKKLQADGLRAAVQEVARTEPSKVHPLFKRIRETTRLLENVKQRDLEQIQNQPAEQQEIRGLYRAVRNIAKLAKIELK